MESALTGSLLDHSRPCGFAAPCQGSALTDRVTCSAAAPPLQEEGAQASGGLASDLNSSEFPVSGLPDHK